MGRSTLWFLLAAALTLAAGLTMLPSRAGVFVDDAARAPPLPELTQRDPAGWLNSPPLTRADLAGRVVLVDVWTFDCWNCYRSFPWLKAVEERYADRGLQVLGVHTPEFAHERVPANVARKVREFGLRHPIMLDAEMRYWRALGNRYWPAYWLVDRAGRVRGVWVGETHAGDAQAREVEAAIERLLAEPAPGNAPALVPVH